MVDYPNGEAAWLSASSPLRREQRCYGGESNRPWQPKPNLAASPNHPGDTHPWPAVRAMKAPYDDVMEAQPAGPRLREIIERAQRFGPIRTAVVHPVDAISLGGAVAAAAEKLIMPVLVGPEARIRATARQAGISLDAYPLVPTEHSEAAATRAVAMARRGEVEALMKGSLHTDELMRPVVDPEQGLRTGRRVSHVFVIDTPRYPRLLLVTDAAVNVSPTLEDKRDIVQNAIELAHILGIEVPRVAILSAVETVTPKIRSTLDAAALCKMADRGQITGAVLDGPLAFDNAVSEKAAAAKGIVSPVSGRADIFLMPDLEAGNMLAKQLEYLDGAQIAGIVLGARVPLMLTSRADGILARLASCAIAALLAHAEASPAAAVTDALHDSGVTSNRPEHRRGDEADQGVRTPAAPP